MKVPASAPSKEEMTADCGQFEVAIEMLIHAALPSAEEAELGDHLVRCESCRSFERLARHTEKTMTAQTAAHIENVDWETLYLRTKQSIGKHTRERVILGTAMLVGTSSMLTLMEHGFGNVLPSLLAGSVLLVVLWGIGRRKFGQLARHREDAGELLFLHRFELEERLRAARRSAIAIPFMIPFGFCVLRGLLVSTQAWIGFGGIVCMMLAVLAWVVLVRLPRLRRELDALKAGATK
jgi:hypothetical protein